MTNLSVEDLVNRYVTRIEDWDANLGSAGKANRIFDEMHQLSTQLRMSADGRDAIETLLNCASRAVRLDAAAVALEWVPEKAVPVLEALVSPRGTHSLSAQMTLREFHAGRLKFDW
ncbi:DUF2019 domain-containing protein [Microbacterium sp.]|uniref:DUF2019 domain-containing protein n=1 Tax=Microbacterium sp. TaxID=51671 RepID=UPI003A907314